MRKERLVCTCMIFHFATYCENCSLDLPVVVVFPLAVSLRASISSKRPLQYPHDHPHSHHRQPRHTHMREKNLPKPQPSSLTPSRGRKSLSFLHQEAIIIITHHRLWLDLFCLLILLLVAAHKSLDPLRNRSQSFIVVLMLMLVLIRIAGVGLASFGFLGC